MPEKLSPRMRTYYILIVAVIVLFSFGAIAGLLYLLEGLGVIPSLGIYTLISLLLVSGITVALMSYFIGRRVLTPLVKLSSASKEVARGNFDVTVSDSSKMEEVQSTFRNFNAMVRELKSISTLSSDFIANVSHDLKTPLTMIRSYAEMIRDLSGDNPEKRNAHLQVIIDETDRMSQLVSDMASVSAMRTNKVVLEKDFFDLSSVAASILASYQLLQEQEGYNFVFNTPKDCIVYADKNKIEQVISNLTGNAIKYCGEDKVVIVNIKRVGKKWRLEVSDNGPGIKPEELPHVWDRYYKTSTNYVRPTNGTGLGLAIVKEILTLHHCNYGVDSKFGKGSTFWFELDAAKKEKEKAPVKPRESLPDRPR